MIIRLICNGNKDIKRIINLYRINQDESKIHISVQSNENIEMMKNNNIIKNNNISLIKNYNNSKNISNVNNKKDLSKSMALPGKKENNHSNSEKNHNK